MMAHWDGGLGIFGLLGLITNLFFVGVVVLGVVLLVRYLNRPGQPGSPGRPRAEAILAERFARGEIDGEEYQSRLRILRGERPAP